MATPSMFGGKIASNRSLSSGGGIASSSIFGITLSAGTVIADNTRELQRRRDLTSRG